ncbi:MAG: hypothetical protein PHG48_02255 [Eubacteriales bacterium]|nr:hypothetical protein [Eubacteriales bacterium]
MKLKAASKIDAMISSAANRTGAVVFIITGIKPGKCIEAARKVVTAAAIFPLLYILAAIAAGRKWYMASADMLLICMAASVPLRVFSIIVKQRLTAGLPETLKVINSRYICRKSMVKAISHSLTGKDIRGPMLRIMSEVRDALQRNEADSVEDTFRSLSALYDDHYLKLFLNLVRKAHAKGGGEAVNEQLETLTEDVMIEIENRKDLMSAGTAYIVPAVLLTAAVKAVEAFGIKTAGDVALDFYEGLAGFRLKTGIFLSLAVFIMSMLRMAESRTVFFMQNITRLFGKPWTKAFADNELELLKRLVIIESSVKPADFHTMLDTLISESLYYREKLEEIRRLNMRNSVEKTDIYKKIAGRGVSLREKLFFEKLWEAQNFDFDQAVKNISCEFRMERREDERNIRKRIELINLWGVMGLMAVLYLLAVYLVIPWMKMFEMYGSGF